jgi:hypothetical protein
MTPHFFDKSFCLQRDKGLLLLLLPGDMPISLRDRAVRKGDPIAQYNANSCSESKYSFRVLRPSTKSACPSTSGSGGGQGGESDGNDECSKAWDMLERSRLPLFWTSHTGFSRVTLATLQVSRQAGERSGQTQQSECKHNQSNHTGGSVTRSTMRYC